MDHYYSFGEWVKVCRIQLGLSQTALASSVGCSTETLEKIEKDERIPSSQIVKQLIEHLQIDETVQDKFWLLARGADVPNTGSPIRFNLDLNYAPKSLNSQDLETRFITQKKIGEGGHGEVYLGLDTQIGTPVVIKRLKQNLNTNANLIARFLRESEALHQLKHPNIVKLLAAFEHDGHHNIVMEYVPNGSLKDLLVKGGPLDQEQSLRIILELTDALSRAHHLGIIHRDIKPGNILMASDGTPLLADFGVAGLLESDSQLTPTKGFIGSPAYASPEAFLGERLDTRSDIWSLGILMYELLIGKRPFQQEPLIALINQIINEPIQPINNLLPEINPSLASLITQMLNKNRGARPSNMRQIGAYIQAIQDGQKISIGKLHLIEENSKKSLVESFDELDDQTRFDRLPTNNVPEIAPLPIGSYLPYPLNPHFSGREVALKTLAEKIKEKNQATAISQVAVTGMGGIGKSQLAIAFAYRYGQFFPGGVFWLSVADPDVLPAEVARLGGEEFLQLYRETSGLSLQDQVAAVKRVWQSETPRLLIFDNVDSDASLAAVQEIRPSGGGCRILMTSRRGNWSKSSGVYPLNLKMFDQSESVALLQKYVPEADEMVLTNIAEELGHLPLALHLAGSFMETYFEYGIGNPSTYLDALREGELLKHASLIGQGIDKSHTNHDLHLARTFTLSLKQLDKTNEVDSLARKLLGLLACLAPGEPVPAWLWQDALPKVNDPLLYAMSAQRLKAVGLIEQSNMGELQQHRLLNAFVQNELALETEEAFDSIVKVVNNQAEEQFKAGYPLALISWQPHFRTIVTAAEDKAHIQTATLFRNLGSHLELIGDYTGAKPCYEKALVINEQTLGLNHEITAQSLDDLGKLLILIGDFPQAKECLEKALKIREKTFGPDHPKTASSLSSIGDLLRELGDIPESRPYFERALSIRETVLGPNHPDTATSLNSLGHIIGYLSDFEKALQYFERALKIREKALGPDHPDTAASLTSIGAWLDTDHDASISLLQRALRINEENLGPNHPNTAKTLEATGLQYLRNSDYLTALDYFGRALDIREKIFVSNHPQIAFIVHYLGNTYLRLGDFLAAKPYYERALNIRKEVLGPEHPQTCISLEALGVIYLKMGELLTAKSYFERALGLNEKTLGYYHSFTCANYNNIGRVYEEMEEYNLAIKYLESAVEIAKKLWGDNYHQTVFVRNNLARIKDKHNAE